MGGQGWVGMGAWVGGDGAALIKFTGDSDLLLVVKAEDVFSCFYYELFNHVLNTHVSVFVIFWYNFASPCLFCLDHVGTSFSITKFVSCFIDFGTDLDIRKLF